MVDTPSSSVIIHDDDPDDDDTPLSFNKFRHASNSSFFARSSRRSNTTPRASSSRIHSIASSLLGDAKIRLPSNSIQDDDVFLVKQDAEKPSIPSLLPGYSPPAFSTPLPTTPIVVLCIAMLSEFLSASTPAAFLYFMIESFFLRDVQEPPDGLEARVAFWSGIVASVFFLSQFITSILWASIAQKHGRRVVLLASLLGNAISLTIFGASSSTGMAICARMGQGVFAGAVGVARGAVRDITDPTNEARAYTLVGLAWGLGGIVGPIIGGLTEHPAVKYPRLFGETQLFIDRPYLLPCMISSCVTLIGAVLSLFLGPDGGPRTGAITLSNEKSADGSPTDEQQQQAPLQKTIVKKMSGYLLNAGRPSFAGSSRQPQPLNMGQAFGTRRVSGHPGQGTSYGYDAKSYRTFHGRRLTNQASLRNSFAARRNSNGASTMYAPDYEDQFEDHYSNLNFAQRLLLAQEPALFNVSDLWVAAAQVQDADEVYTQDMDWDEDVFEEDDEVDQSMRSSRGVDESTSDPPSLENLRLTADRQHHQLGMSSARGSIAASDETARRRPTASSTALFSPRNRITSRKASVQSMRPHIFNNTGLKSDPFTNARSEDAFTPLTPNNDSNLLAPIPEGQQALLAPPNVSTPLQPFPPQLEEPGQPSIFMQLPLSIIFQLFVLAFHGEVNGQIFMSFLVTPVASGGLGLNASHYAELVSVMIFFQMFFQFYAYPNIGPPRGSLSHLAMLRLGLVLYLPVYFLFPTLRTFLSETSNAWVMFFMILFSALRYLANVCAYTSIMVLTNAQTPPHLLSMANGLAQSAASAARFLGPLVGGAAWSWSIANGPTGRPWPYDYHFGFFVAMIVCFSGLLISLKLR